MSGSCRGEVELRRKRARAKRNVHRRLGASTLRPGNSSISLAASRCITFFAGFYYPLLSPKSSSPVYSPDPYYNVSTSPFPFLVPLDVLPFTSPPFPPLCSNCIRCLPASLPTDPTGPSLKASRLAWLCIPPPSFCWLGYIPNVNTAVSVQDHAVHGRL